MAFTEQSVESLSPNPGAFNSGKSLTAKQHWLSLSKNERAAWGEIKGSGKSPYQVSIDIHTLGYKCNCPSRQFPCKHAIALMLLIAQSSPLFETGTHEPDWVNTWIEKRTAKATKKEDNEAEGDEPEKPSKSSEKTQLKRVEDAMAGALEMETWLTDMVRMGILDLPNKPAKDFATLAARMVDAKAPGLAGWARSFTKINYHEANEWQSEATKIIAKLYLLVKTFQNHDNLPPLWQQTVKTLIGWNQSPKELAENRDAERVTDKWLVIGQENETIDDIVVQRNWLVGCQSNRRALILNFATRFSNFETSILAGSIINAELAFFPSAMPLRAIVTHQRQFEETLETMPQFFGSLAEMFTFKSEQITRNPWSNDHAVLIDNVNITRHGENWVVFDGEKDFMPISKHFEVEKTMRWLSHSGNKPQRIAAIVRNQYILPLGVFTNHQYILL